MADRRPLLVPLVIIAFLFLSPDPRFASRDFQHLPSIDDTVKEEQRWLDVVANSTHNSLLDEKDSDGGYGLNITGFEPGRDFAWDALGRVKVKAWDSLQYAAGEWGVSTLEGPSTEPRPFNIYSNVTGVAHGKWARSKLADPVRIPQLNLSAYAPENPFGGRMSQGKRFERNFTGETGDVSIRFNEKASARDDGWALGGASNISEMNIELTLTDDLSGNEDEMLLRGVYFLDIGQAVLTTTSEKFAGIFALPHLALSEHTFNLSRTVLNTSISKIIERQKIRDIGSLNPWSANMGPSDEPDYPPKCDLVLWLQQLPLETPTVYSSDFHAFLERELRFPTGAIIPSAPEIWFSMVAFSPDCGYVLESIGPPAFVPQDGNHIVGPKREVLQNRARRHVMMFALVIALQLVLLMRQMREANTPSTRSRISIYSIAGMAMGDGFVALSLCFISLLFDGLWLQLIGIAFLAFMSVLFFGMQFLMNIWAVQAPERRRREREEAEAAANRLQESRRRSTLGMIRRMSRDPAASPDAVDSPSGAESPSNGATLGDTAPETPAQLPFPNTLPLPVTATRPVIDTGATPLFMPSDQAGLLPVTEGTPAPANTVPESRVPSFGSLYARFYIILVIILFASLNALTWPPAARHFFFTTLSLVYLSFWIPQMNRNTVRNCRRALTWEFVLGHSILRLMPFVYFYGYKNNVLFLEKDNVSLTILAAWVWIQVVLLASQEIIGPRWFVKSAWVPPAYDYHPILREDEEGASLPLGLSDSASSNPPSPLTERRGSLTSSSSPTLARRASIPKESKERGKRVFDCAICMQDLEVPVIEADGFGGSEGSAGLMLARRLYMVTPCRHIFHSACLEGWMKYRLQCPICREGLPPL